MPLDLAAECESDDEALGHHLVSAAVIPESFGHDSTEEKLFAKYTDHVISLAFEAVGCRSAVTLQRADAADVEGEVPEGPSFVADAKAFRLSRTAKNQKDFKVEALAGWKGIRDFAVLVAPWFQYPSARSQIYEQATRRNVCLLGYVHLRALLTLPEEDRLAAFQRLLAAPSNRDADKSASTYWAAVEAGLTDGGRLSEAWNEAYESEVRGLAELRQAEEEYLLSEVERIHQLDRDQLADMLADRMNLPGRLEMVRSVAVAARPAP
jgi:type II restriction enzyme